MEAYHDATPLWEFPGSSNSYNPMHDVDFMSMLDKQFPGNSGLPADPLTLTGFSNPSNAQDRNKTALSSRSSPSDDSPSPNGSFSDTDLPAPKRKATDDADEGPSSKSHHTMKAGSSSSGRRKSTGNPAKDETRLLKRKEQNRAAQRAFRERKEKHVKDLEDKVAQLEAKNDEAAHENVNLRDLLTRLQTENVMLKQGQFTFSVPREGTQSFQTEMGSFPQAAPSPPSARSSFAAPATKSPKPLDWSSLTTFDPSRLNLLDEVSSQPTATDSAMQLDFGFGSSGPNTPYTTLASNPMFMSFASSFDPTSPSADSPNLSTPSNSHQNFNFDMNSLTTWPAPQNGQDGSLDDLLQGYLVPNTNLDFSFLTSPISASPVTHHISPTSGASRTISLSSSPSSSSTDPLFTPKDSPSETLHGDGSECPKTKAELVKRIEESGPSPFGPACSPGVRKSTDGILAMISCEGTTSFPKTLKSEQNIEVLSAWRSITSDPKFKDTDMSELCSEFTSKARCDGTKVVLEPAGVHSIIESLSKKQQQ